MRVHMRCQEKRLTGQRACLAARSLLLRLPQPSCTGARRLFCTAPALGPARCAQAGAHRHYRAVTRTDAHRSARGAVFYQVGGSRARRSCPAHPHSRCWLQRIAPCPWLPFITAYLLLPDPCPFSLQRTNEVAGRYKSGAFLGK